MNFFSIWLVLLLLKLSLGIFFPLVYDEAYYWVWSKNLSWSYFDHPPMVAWLMWLGQIFEPFASAVRIPAILLGHASLLIWNKVLESHLSLQQRKFWLVLVGLSPLLGFGGIFVTPDLPLLFFWSLSIYMFQKCLKNPSGITYSLLGASLGLGFCSKYNIVILVPALFLWLIFNREFYRVKYRYIGLTIVFGLIFSMPVLYWNYINDFISFKFQLGHGLKPKKWKPEWPVEYVIGQVLLIFPTLFYFALRAKSAAFLKILAWTPLLFFLLTSFKGRVEGNWPLVAYPAIYALAVLGESRRRWLHFPIAIWFFAFGLVFFNYHHDFIGSKEIKGKGRELLDLKSLNLSQYHPLYAINYQLASKLSWDYKKPYFKYQGLSRPDYFDFNSKNSTEERFYLLATVKDSKRRIGKKLSIHSEFMIDEYHIVFEVSPK